MSQQQPIPPGELLLDEIKQAYKESKFMDIINKAEFAITQPENEKDITLRAMLTVAYAKHNRWEEARRMAQETLSLDQYLAEIWHILGTALAMLGDPKEAVISLDNARALTPFAEEATILKLLEEKRAILFSQRTWIGVLETIDAELAIKPNDLNRLVMRANALERLGREAEALACFRELANRPDATAQIWLARARLAYTIENNQSEAENSWQVASQLTSLEDPFLKQVKRQLDTPIRIDKFSKWLKDRGFMLKVSKDIEFILPPLCEVTGGHCLIGSDPIADPDVYENEKPQHNVVIEPFKIARYPVTVAEYSLFVKNGGSKPSTYEGLGTIIDWSAQLRRPDHPVVCVTWYQACDYVTWLSDLTGQHWRLPSEVEWEYAARWDSALLHARIYPWGDAFDSKKCNTNVSRIGTTTRIGSYINDSTPWGLHDIAGNVWEWTNSLFKPYPYDTNQEDHNDAGIRVMKGGSWNFIPREARTADRDNDSPNLYHHDIGFRIALYE